MKAELDRQFAEEERMRLTHWRETGTEYGYFDGLRKEIIDECVGIMKLAVSLSDAIYRLKKLRYEKR